MKTESKKRLFPLGQVVATPVAIDLMMANEVGTSEILKRHQCGDWGELVPEDCSVNEDAIRCGDRIHSAYKLGECERLWVITEADRSVTTLLLPSEC